jgi:hypothetical protein
MPPQAPQGVKGGSMPPQALQGVKGAATPPQGVKGGSMPPQEVKGAATPPPRKKTSPAQKRRKAVLTKLGHLARVARPVAFVESSESLSPPPPASPFNALADRVPYDEWDEGDATPSITPRHYDVRTAALMSDDADTGQKRKYAELLAQQPSDWSDDDDNDHETEDCKRRRS